MCPPQYHPKQFHVFYKSQCPQESACTLLITTETLAALTLPAAKKKNKQFLLFVCSQEPIREIESFDEPSPVWNSWIPQRWRQPTLKHLPNTAKQEHFAVASAALTSVLTFSFFVYWMTQLSTSVRGQSIYSTFELIKPKIKLINTLIKNTFLWHTEKFFTNINKFTSKIIMLYLEIILFQNFKKMQEKELNTDCNFSC